MKAIAVARGIVRGIVLAAVAAIITWAIRPRPKLTAPTCGEHRVVQRGDYLMCQSSDQTLIVRVREGSVALLCVCNEGKEEDEEDSEAEEIWREEYYL